MHESETTRAVRAEVAIICGQKIEYTPRNISTWLKYWHETFTSANRWWRATVETDIRRAVSTLQPNIRLFFQLYCIEGLDFGELRECMGWSHRTCWRKWHELTKGVIDQLCDTRIIDRQPRGLRGPVPLLYAGSFEGKFPQPPDRR